MKDSTLGSIDAAVDETFFGCQRTTALKILLGGNGRPAIRPPFDGPFRRSAKHLLLSLVLGLFGPHYGRAEVRLAFLPDRGVRPTPSLDAADAGPAWLEMDYGPAITTTLETTPGHITSKAIAVRVDQGSGGFAQGRDYAAFDTDALRCVAGWRGRGGIDYRGVAYDGHLEGEAGLIGSLLFENPDVAGWGRGDGSAWEESRYVGRDGRRYGPLDPSQGRWLGYYQQDDRIVWSYRVYETPVQESPGSIERDGLPMFSRNFEIGARPEPLLLQIAYDESGSAELYGAADASVEEQVVVLAAPGMGARATLRTTRRSAEKRDDLEDEEEGEEYEDEEEAAEFEDEDTEYADETEEVAEDGDGDGAEENFDSDRLEFEGDASLLIRDKQAFNLSDDDYTILAKIRTEQGGTIFAQAPESGAYAENSKSLFVSGGALQFDVGWVGAVRAEKKIDDGRWRNVALTFSSSTGEVRLYVDGEESGSGELRPTESVDRAQVLRIGFTAVDFPDFVRGFVGEIAELAFYQRQLSDAEIRAFNAGKPSEERLVAHWINFDHERDLLVDATGGGHDAFLEDISYEEPEDEKETDDAAHVLRFDGESVRLSVGNLPVDEAARSSYSIAARIRTKEGGPIFAVAAADGTWQPNNLCWFVRDGRLVFDLGFVGQAEGSADVADGQWHDVAMSYDRETGKVRFLVDGKQDRISLVDEAGEDFALAPLELEEDAKEKATAWIGYASDEFPEEAPHYFSGLIEQLRIYEGTLGVEEVARVMALPADESLGVVAAWTPSLAVDGIVEDLSGNEFDAVVEREAEGEPVAEVAIPYTACGVVGAPQGSRWVLTDDGHVRLQIPAGHETIQMTVWYAGLEDREARGELLAPLPLLAPLAAKPSLTEPLAAKPLAAKPQAAVMGNASGSFVVDEISLPAPNPHGSRMRLCGLDFFADGQRAALSTLAGEVWVVDGLGTDELASCTWRRIATGLYQPLGLRIVDEQIYVLCRDQIARLNDEDGDGQIDFYECFNHDAQVTAHYGEFAVDLETDAEGNFYYAKGARRGLPPLVPQHGTLLRVAADGSSTQIVATGFRAPAGLAPAGDGRFYATDLAGRWTPANKVNLVREGQFYGNNYAFNPPTTADRYQRPMVWIDDAVDGGPSDVVPVTSHRWVPLKGQLLCLSNASGAIHVVLRQTTATTGQGAVYQLPSVRLPAASCRGRFNPSDGQLYVCGLGDPEGKPGSPGGFYRIRATGRPANLPTQLSANDEGLAITFSDRLDPASATDWRNYAAARWSYRRTAQYGSDRYRVSDPRRRGRDRLRIEDVRLSEDRRTVLVKFLEMPAADQMRLQLSVKSERGDPVGLTLHFTYHTPGDGRSAVD